jgi:extracellular matrix protein 14
LNTLLLPLALSHHACASSKRAPYSPSIPHEANPSPTLNSNDRLFPFLAWLRNSAIEFIFGPPPTVIDRTAPHPRNGARTQYDNEIVLRFNLSCAEEEAALSEAASRLFLDVWAFTPEFVDIRMHKDDVPRMLSVIPPALSLSYSTLIPDLDVAVYSNYQPVGRWQDGVATQQNSLTDENNVFFQDYQSLAVRFLFIKLESRIFVDTL